VGMESGREEGESAHFCVEREKCGRE
jgi:hypothetical protein